MDNNVRTTIVKTFSHSEDEDEITFTLNKHGFIIRAGADAFHLSLNHLEDLKWLLQDDEYLVAIDLVQREAALENEENKYRKNKEDD